jgi:hypothetical protein
LVNVEFSIWMATKTRWAHLTKVIPMPVVPRVGEFMKFRNAEHGDYFAWRVTQVTYRERDDAIAVEIHTELLDDVDQRGYSFEAEADFDEYMNSYVREGWTSQGIRPNRRYKPSANPRDPNDAA